MGGAQFTDTTHMAGCAGGRAIVAWFPGVGSAVPNPVFAVGQVDMAVLAVLEDFNIRMVWPQVAGGTRIGFAGFDNAEFMAGVAGGAVAGAAIRIDITHPHIGPG